MGATWLGVASGCSEGLAGVAWAGGAGGGAPPGAADGGAGTGQEALSGARLCPCLPALIFLSFLSGAASCIRNSHSISRASSHTADTISDPLPLLPKTSAKGATYCACFLASSSSSSFSLLIMSNIALTWPFTALSR
eukprot:Skav221468  [mRNA]  locus=scaffold1700:410813:417705:- [translate_table: standard]